MVPHHVPPREDAEDQSVITTSSSRSTPTKTAKSRSIPPSKPKGGKGSRNSKHLIYPHMVGFEVCFPDGNGEGRIIEAVCMDVGYTDEDLRRYARFKISFGNDIVEKQFHETWDHTRWLVRYIEDHQVPFDNNTYKVKVSWKALARFAYDPTWETLEYAAEADREACIKYARKKNLLNTPGWTFLKDTEEFGVSEEYDDYKHFASDAAEKPAYQDEDDAYQDDSSEDTEVPLQEDVGDDDEWQTSLAVDVSQDSTYSAPGGSNILDDRPDEQRFED